MTAGFEAAVSVCRSRAHWHKQGDLGIHEIEHLNLQLHHERVGAFSTLQAVQIGEYRAEMDWAGRIIRQPTGHSDPLFLIEADGKPGIEVSLYDLDLTQATTAGLELVMLNDDHQPCPLTAETDAPDAALITDIDWQWPTPKLTVTAPSGGEIIWQRVYSGEFEEERQMLPKGTSEFDIPPSFSDYYGISVSDDAIFGASEHKHILVGELGVHPTRPMMDLKSGDIRPPKLAEPDRYKSLILRDADGALTDDTLTALLKDWHCIEVVGAGEKPNWLNEHADHERVKWTPR
ncbi:MAG: hypothetical protein KI792_10935 [Alphaproteobacteria bacterium]|nr:hypothetical protein [Alphaproteobacteria bacterium SS10]